MTLAEYLTQVRARLEAATPGPWKRDPQGRPSGQVIAKGNEVIIYQASHPRQIDANVVANCALVASAPQDIARLLEVVERMRETISNAMDHAANIQKNHPNECAHGAGYSLLGQLAQQTETDCFYALEEADAIAAGKGGE